MARRSTLATAGPIQALSVHQGFLLTTGVWLASALAAALPLMFAEFDLNFTNAFFEAMSGLTTTGATVVVGLDQAPPGILLWRSILQWVGGIGFIVVGLAILPFLQMGGMQLFRLESSEKSDKAVPQAKRFAFLLLSIYIGLSTACMIALLMAGMTPLEAVAQAMSTVATGGFSTSDGSIGHFRQPDHRGHHLGVHAVREPAIPALPARSCRAGATSCCTTSRSAAICASCSS